MTDDVRARLTALLAENAEHQQQLAREHERIVSGSELANADDEHDPEGATIAFERSQLGALVQQTRDHLSEIEAAQRRLLEGTYGVCERCGSRIPEGRLEARPSARTCVACASGAR